MLLKNKQTMYDGAMGWIMNCMMNILTHTHTKRNKKSGGIWTKRRFLTDEEEFWWTEVDIGQLSLKGFETLFCQV